jgi:Protein of unknown function (DUF3455)
MKQTVFGSSLAILAIAALAAGCSDDAPLAPSADRAGLEPRVAEEGAAYSIAGRDPFESQPALCSNLQPRIPVRLATAVYAEGVQVYSWNGTTWAFVAPDAQLFANSHGQGRIGSHYAGPTWETNSGSKVHGAVVDRCTPDPDAVPWLLLGVTSTEGSGIFEGVVYIQRLHTTGGNAPTGAGAFIGDEARVPYTAEYYFYRAS